MNEEQIYPMEPKIKTLIQQTLQHLREGASQSRNPLESTLEAYRQTLRQLPHGELDRARGVLMHQIMQEDDLSTRFVLKLMHDVTEAVREGRRPAYLMPAIAG